MKQVLSDKVLWKSSLTQFYPMTLTRVERILQSFSNNGAISSNSAEATTTAASATPSAAAAAAAFGAAEHHKSTNLSEVRCREIANDFVVRALDAALSTPRSDGTFGADPSAAPAPLPLPVLPTPPWQSYLHLSSPAKAPLGHPAPPPTLATVYDVYAGGADGVVSPDDRDYCYGEYSPMQYLAPLTNREKVMPEVATSNYINSSAQLPLPYHILDSAPTTPLPATQSQVGQFMTLAAATAPPTNPVSDATGEKTVESTQNFVARAAFWAARTDRLDTLLTLAGVTSPKGVRPWQPPAAALPTPPLLELRRDTDGWTSVGAKQALRAMRETFLAIYDAPLAHWYVNYLVPTFAAFAGPSRETLLPEVQVAVAAGVLRDIIAARTDDLSTRPDTRTPRWALFITYFMVDCGAAMHLVRKLFDHATTIAKTDPEATSVSIGRADARPSDAEAATGDAVTHLQMIQCIVRCLQFFAPVPLPLSAYPGTSREGFRLVTRALTDQKTTPMMAKAMLSHQEKKNYEATLPNLAAPATAAESAQNKKGEAEDEESIAASLAVANARMDAIHSARYPVRSAESLQRRYPVEQDVADRVQVLVLEMTFRWYAHTLSLSLATAQYGRWSVVGPAPAKNDAAAAAAAATTTSELIRSQQTYLYTVALECRQHASKIINAKKGAARPQSTLPDMAKPLPILGPIIESIVLLASHPFCETARASAWVLAEVLDSDDKETIAGPPATDGTKTDAPAPAASAGGAASSAKISPMFNQQLVFRPYDGLILPLRGVIELLSKTTLSMEVQARFRRIMETFSTRRWQVPTIIYIASGEQKPTPAAAAAAAAGGPACEGEISPVIARVGRTESVDLRTSNSFRWTFGDTQCVHIPSNNCGTAFGYERHEMRYGSILTYFMERVFRIVALGARYVSSANDAIYNSQLYPNLLAAMGIRSQASTNAKDGEEPPTPPMVVSTVRNITVGAAASNNIRLRIPGIRDQPNDANVLEIQLSQLVGLANAAYSRSHCSDRDAACIVEAVAAALSKGLAGQWSGRPALPANGLNLDLLFTGSGGQAELTNLWTLITNFLDEDSSEHEMTNQAAWNLIYALARYHGSKAIPVLEKRPTRGARSSVLDIGFTSISHRKIGFAFETFTRILQLQDEAPASNTHDEAAAATIASRAGPSMTNDSFQQCNTNLVAIDADISDNALAAPYGTILAADVPVKRYSELTRVIVNYAFDDNRGNNQQDNNASKYEWAPLRALASLLLPVQDAASGPGGRDRWTRGFAYTKVVAFLTLLWKQLDATQRESLNRAASTHRGLSEMLSQASK